MIEMVDVDFGYRKKTVFSGLNLRLSPGSVCGLLGENGVGKTTLLYLLAGLLQPDGGQCRVVGMTPAARLPEFLEQLYFLGEEIPAPDWTGTEYVRRRAEFYPRFDGDFFQRAVTDFRLDPGQNLKRMSYGTRKKFFLAFAFAANTAVLLLDEPTNGLDIPSKSAFRKLVAEVVGEDKVMVISTHQVRDLENIIDPVVILADKELVLNRTMAELQQKLLFSLEPDEPAAALYAEKVPGGWAVVSDRVSAAGTGPAAEVQLELLFNAVMRHPDRIRALWAAATEEDKR